MSLTYCKYCLEPNTRPDCQFENGVCLPCRYNMTINEIDWQERRNQLDEIVKWGKERNVSGYDCIIPVSGGKDSHRQAIYVKDELGLKPLLVSLTYPPEQQTHRGAHNLANLIKLGFDCYAINPGPATWRKLMKFTFMSFGNIFKASELAIYSSAPRIATLYNIPLIVYGENPSLSWGSAGGSTDGDANKLRDANTLKGGDLSPYIDSGFEHSELYWFTYPPHQDVERANLRMIYLGYYISDFNDIENSRIALESGLEPRMGIDAIPEDTGQIYFADALDDDFVIINQFLKHLKFGFGKTSEQCSGAIRAGVMTREEGLEKTTKYDGKCATRYIERFCKYIDISIDTFWEIAESYRNHDIWIKVNGEWKLKCPPV